MSSEYVGYDTETQHGCAILQATPNDYQIITPTQGEAGAHFHWLLTRKHSRRYVAHNLRYDAQALFAWLPRKTCWRLARLGDATYRDYRLQWIPGKRLVISHPLHGRAWLYDVLQFFHMSLEQAAQKHLGVGKHPIEFDITRMQAALDGPTREKAIEYCKHDALLAEKLFRLVLDGLSEACVKPTEPLSPAFIAGKHFLAGQKRASRHINEIGKRAYHGGRVECQQLGRFESACHIDIHSAYPAVMAELPNPADLRLVIGNKPRPDAVLGIYHVSMDIDPGEHLGATAYGSQPLTYPVGKFETWLSRPEYYAVKEFVKQVYECWEWMPRQGHKPRLLFPDIERLYHLKQSDPRTRMAAKLVLNGLSGKLAQRDRRYELATFATHDIEIDNDYYKAVVRDGWKSNFILAAHVTGAIRARVWRVAREHAHNVIAIQTDGLWLSMPVSAITLPGGETYGDTMGEWDIDIPEADLLMLANGVYTYQDSATGKVTTKLRGFRSKIDLRELLSDYPRANSVPVEVSLPATMLWALQRDEPINKIGKYTRDLALGQDVKRVWPEGLAASDYLRYAIKSYPLHIMEA